VKKLFYSVFPGSFIGESNISKTELIAIKTKKIINGEIKNFTHDKSFPVIFLN